MGSPARPNSNLRTAERQPGAAPALGQSGGAAELRARPEHRQPAADPVPGPAGRGHRPADAAGVEPRGRERRRGRGPVQRQQAGFLTAAGTPATQVNAQSLANDQSPAVHEPLHAERDQLDPAADAAAERALARTSSRTRRTRPTRSAARGRACSRASPRLRARSTSARWPRSSIRRTSARRRRRRPATSPATSRRSRATSRPIRPTSTR